MECISSRNRLRDLGPSHPHQADQCLLLPTVADPGTKLAKSDQPHDCSYSLPFFFSAVTQQGTFSSLQKDTFHLQFTCFSPLTALLTESTRTSIVNPSSYALTSQTGHQMTQKSQNTSWKSRETRAVVLEFEDRFYGSKMLPFCCSKLISLKHF